MELQIRQELKELLRNEEGISIYRDLLEDLIIIRFSHTKIDDSFESFATRVTDFAKSKGVEGKVKFEVV